MNIYRFSQGSALSDEWTVFTIPGWAPAARQLTIAAICLFTCIAVLMSAGFDGWVIALLWLFPAVFSTRKALREWARRNDPVRPGPPIEYDRP